MGTTNLVYNEILQVWGWYDQGGFWHQVDRAASDVALDLWDQA